MKLAVSGRTEGPRSLPTRARWTMASVSTRGERAPFYLSPRRFRQFGDISEDHCSCSIRALFCHTSSVVSRRQERRFPEMKRLASVGAYSANVTARRCGGRSALRPINVVCVLLDSALTSTGMRVTIAPRVRNLARISVVREAHGDPYTSSWRARQWRGRLTLSSYKRVAATRRRAFQCRPATARNT
jgi:hypothetical protein